MYFFFFLAMVLSAPKRRNLRSKLVIANILESQWHWDFVLTFCVFMWMHSVNLLVEGSVLLPFDVILLFFFPWQITFSAHKAEMLSVTQMAPAQLFPRRHPPWFLVVSVRLLKLQVSVNMEKRASILTVLCCEWSLYHLFDSSEINQIPE